MERKSFLQVLTAFSFGPVFGQEAVAASGQEPDRSTPESTLRAFATAVKSKDVSAMVKCVQGATGEPAIIKEMFPSPFEVVINKATSYYTEEKDRALVEANLTINLNDIAQGTGFTSYIHMVRGADGWQIVPISPAEVELEKRRREDGAESAIGLIAMMVRNPGMIAAANHRFRVETAIANVKQICTGVLMYLEDYEENFPKSPTTFKKDLQPYVTDEKIFTSPLDPVGTQSFKLNPQVAGKTLATVGQPVVTVLIYEGDYKKPLFRYEGKALIGFVDGQVKLVTREEASQLRWSW